MTSMQTYLNILGSPGKHRERVLNCCCNNSICVLRLWFSCSSLLVLLVCSLTMSTNCVENSSLSSDMPSATILIIFPLNSLVLLCIRAISTSTWCASRVAELTFWSTCSTIDFSCSHNALSVASRNASKPPRAELSPRNSYPLPSDANISFFLSVQCPLVGH